MIKAVFWDLGGTICRTDGGGKILGAIRMTQAIKPFCGNFYKTLHKVIKMMRVYQTRKNTAQREPKMDDLLKEVFQCRQDLRRKMAKAIHLGALKYATPLSGVHEALDYLSQLQLPMALVSDGFYGPEFVCSILKQLGMEDHFQKVIISSEVGFSKPHPQLFLSACQEMNVRPDEVVFIGDREDRDIAGASGVGMKTVLVGKRPQKTVADLHIKNLSLLKNNFPHLIEKSPYSRRIVFSRLP